MSAISRVKALLLALFLCWAQAAFAEATVPPLVGRVVDTTNTLNGSSVEALNQRIRDFEKRKGSQIAVLIVPTTQPETIEQYSLRAAETWKIGRKKIDDGALLVIAKNDHKLRIEVGYGLEGALTDVTARRIIDEVIVPHFKTGDFAGGIGDGLNRMIGVIDGERLPAPKPEASHGPEPDWNALSSFLPFALFGALFVGSFLRALFGTLAGSFVSGGVVAVIAWLVVGSLIAAAALGGLAFLIVLIADAFQTVGPSRRGGYSGSSGSWGGGGGGWSSGGSSSSDSGGGGGSFGGGGASGSW
ncbi:MAG TPA: YgcG family protein [Bradyrhizobium sp.]